MQAVADDDGGTLRLEATLPAPPQVVFDHFTDPELLTSWWAETATTDPVVGGRYELGWPSHDWVLAGTYVAVEPGQLLAFTWSFAHETLTPSTVTLRFEPEGDGTHLVIEHTYTTDDERDGYQEGWDHFLERLRAAVDGNG